MSNVILAIIYSALGTFIVIGLNFMFPQYGGIIGATIVVFLIFASIEILDKKKHAKRIR
jgi:hypothetical protein